jgi:hypothetical protein
LLEWRYNSGWYVWKQYIEIPLWITKISVMLTKLSIIHDFMTSSLWQVKHQIWNIIHFDSTDVPW